MLESLREHELLAANVVAESTEGWTFGDRLSDRIATFGGSWRFLISFGVFMGLWVLANSLVVLYRHEKVDHLLIHQRDRLVEIQNVQLEILSELAGRK